MALLVAATFIDYDLTIIPDEITITGMVVGIGLGTLFPEIRPEPALRPTHGGGLAVGIVGMLVGGGLTAVLPPGGVAAPAARGDGLRRRDPDGNDRRLPGLARGGPDLLHRPLLRPGTRALETGRYLAKRLSGGQLTSTDREIPFGPYLSMAAVALVLSLALALAELG